VRGALITLVMVTGCGEVQVTGDAAHVTDDGPADAVSNGPADALADAPAECRFRSVAYGQDSTGAPAGRRSALMCLVEVRPDGRILVTSSVAANCPGDSGGPLFIDGTLQTVGVLNSAYCMPGNRSMFVSVDKHRAFIESALANH
jgi:hypothetical protein